MATLFVTHETEQWGTFDAETRTARLRADASADSYDLFDLAAAHTLLNGGVVHVADAEAVPGEGSLAAVYRF